MIVVLAPTELLAEKAAQEAGLRPNQCVLVWDLDSLSRVCQADLVERTIEVDLDSIDKEVRLVMAAYLTAITENPKLGFGWRWTKMELDTEDDPE